MPAWPSRLSAAAPSTTASSCPGCATAPASRRRRWSGSANSSPARVSRRPRRPRELMQLLRVGRRRAGRRATGAGQGAPSRNFRFFDNRQKYLLFVNTCGEKETVARRVGMELAHLHPEPPAVRVFDAGMGDGTVLTRVMREMHRRLPTLPFYVVGKEISLEDARLCLDKMADRFHEHPATVLVVTNMYYTEAPWLTPKAVSAATSLVWHEVALTGTTAAEFSEQIEALEPFLAKNWQARHSAQDRQPHLRAPGGARHLPRRLPLPARRRDPAAGPGARRLRPRHRLAALSRARAGRVQGRQGRSRRWRARCGPAAGCSASIPAAAIRAWRSCARSGPTRTRSQTTRHDILRAVRAELGRDARHYNFNAYADQPRRVPLRHAHAAHRDRRRHRHVHAVCGLERRGLRGADRRRAPRRRARFTAQLPRRHARGAAGARQPVVPR